MTNILSSDNLNTLTHKKALLEKSFVNGTAAINQKLYKQIVPTSYGDLLRNKKMESVLERKKA